MRYAIAILVICLVGCESSRDKALTDAERAQAVVLRHAEAKQSLQAFGGTLVGKDEGEWGGEVAFKKPDGSSYTVIADNSHGIFDMPYGVIALTGLAHLGSNRGTVHLLYRQGDSLVSAKPLVQLPGAPCDVMRVGDRITMRIPSGHKMLPNGIMTSAYSCYALVSSKELMEYKCPAPEPEICSG